MAAPNPPTPEPTKLVQLLDQPMHDPREYLRSIGEVQAQALTVKWDNPAEMERLVTLRRGEHKPHRELKDACLFACLMEQLMCGREDPDIRVKVVPPRDQDDDADAYLLWHDRVGQRFAPVQLKELPPEHLNARATLDELLLKLRKYPPSRQPPVVAVYTNRTMHVAEITVPAGLNVASLWLYGAVTPDASRWCLLGDLLGTVGYRDLPLGL